MKQQYLFDCPDYLKDYLTYIRIVLNHSECTADSYYIDLRIFLRYLKVINGYSSFDNFDLISIADVPLSYLEKFTLSEAYSYMSFLAEVRNNSSASRYRKTSSLKRFYNYLFSKAKLISVNPVLELDHPRKNEPLPRFLSLEQSLRLLSNIESRHQARDFCIILLFLSCGMRLSELTSLDIEDYSPLARTLRILGKGRQERIVYLCDSCVRSLNEYLAIRPRSDHEPRALFLSQYLTRISPKSVHKMVIRQLESSGLSNLGITVHKLRHTAATLLYESGVDILVLKDILGHKSLTSTQIYTHIIDSDRKRAAQLSPFSQI